MTGGVCCFESFCVFVASFVTICLALGAFCCMWGILSVDMFHFVGDCHVLTEPIETNNCSVTRLFCSVRIVTKSKT